MSRRIKKIKELEKENWLEDIILDEYDPDLPIVLPNLHLAEESTSEYLDERWFAIYFDAIIGKIFSTNKDICLFTSNYAIDYFIIIDFFNFKYYISELLAKSIEKCQDINNRFYILPIKLNFNYIAHSNIIIIDNQKKTIEFLEPYGEFIDANLPYDTKRYVLQIIDMLFLAHPIDLRTYKFINVQKNCPRGGLQTIQSKVNPGSGYCLAWSLLFINIKLYNLNVDSDYIIKYLLNSFSSDELNTYIKRFMGFVESSSSEIKLYQDTTTPIIEYNIELSENDKKKISKRIYDLVNKLKSSTITADERSLVNKELVSYHNFPKFQEVYFESINLSSFARPDYYS